MALRATPEQERQVFEALSAGDAGAMEEVVSSHGGWLRGVVYGVLGRRDELDDAMQQVWLNVWKKASGLDSPERGRAWLYRIAHHTAIDFGRRATRRRGLWRRLASWAGKDRAIDPTPRPSGERCPWRDDDGRPLDRMVEREEHERLLRAVATLPVMYRQPLVLKHVSGWSYREIGRTMGLPVDTVETRLVRARRLVRRALEDGRDGGSA